MVKSSNVGAAFVGGALVTWNALVKQRTDESQISGSHKQVDLFSQLARTCKIEVIATYVVLKSVLIVKYQKRVQAKIGTTIKSCSAPPLALQ